MLDIFLKVASANEEKRLKQEDGAPKEAGLRMGKAVKDFVSKQSAPAETKQASVHSTDLADQWGRELARADMEKAAAVQELEAQATLAGIAMVKMSSIGEQLMSVVSKHPGAIAGGVLGGMHGLMHEGGGMGSAALEAAGGAALGHGAQSIVAKKFPEMGKALTPLKDRASDYIKGMMSKAAPAPEAALGASVKTSMDKKAFGALLAAAGGALAKAAPGLLGGAAKAAPSLIGGATKAAPSLLSKGLGWVAKNPGEAASVAGTALTTGQQMLQRPPAY